MSIHLESKSETESENSAETQVTVPENEKAIVDMLKLPGFASEHPLQTGKDAFFLDETNYPALAVGKALEEIDLSTMKALLDYPDTVMVHNNITGHGGCGGEYLWPDAIRFTDSKAVMLAIKADSKKMFPAVAPFLSQFGFFTDVVSDPKGERALAVYDRYRRFLQELPGALQAIPHDVNESLPLLEDAEILGNYQNVATTLGVSVEGLSLEEVQGTIYQKASEGIDHKLFLSENLWKSLAKIHDADVHLMLPTECRTAIFDETEEHAYADFTTFQRTVLPANFLERYDAAQFHERYILQNSMDAKFGLERYYTSRFMACREHFMQLFKELDDLKTGKVDHTSFPVA